ncbi:kinesin light chain [Penicillium canariense]|uniref:Kinesin light chain n=1 Tax=Penicillium canariense TaxID=189055 RepID=A0A9W9LEG7_9EURO|nr:kinesin light chain [Penicillium canariense]KAJ5151145.1 kinesin light chain [Penicillium canariense]
MARRLRHDAYTVGWVCALTDELTAAQEMLDEEHQDLASNSNDSNIYMLGCIGGHNVVLACLPAGQTGTNSAATVAIQMKTTFPAIRFGLMVGIGGGVPGKDADVRLGDIAVSQPANGHGGVVQYDFGKSTPSGFKRTGFLNAPPPILLAAITKLRSNQDRGRGSLTPHLLKLSNLPKFSRDQAGTDVLFEAEYNHVGEGSFHYGTIASGNQVMRDGVERDKVSSEFEGVLCFEMEAAGLMNNFPCLVIRGICDYSDSHKNKRWQPYAAGTAAAYAKELLLVIPAADVVNTQTVNKATQEHMRSFYLPFLRNLQFVGRSAELDTLKQKLLVNKDCRKVALSGLGGIGKTQVALQFAYSFKEDYPEFSIFWVQALSMETFEQGCMEIARALGLHQDQESKEDVKELIRRQLCTKSAGKWLLIVDNVDDLDLLRGLHQTDGLLAFLPESDDGLSIFTTRHGEVAQHLAGSDVVEIGRMTGQETVNLLEKSLVRKSPSHNNQIVMDLLTELEYLPLAITQAAAYINTNKSSISEYLRLLKSTEQDAVAIMSTDFGDRTRYPNLTNAVAKTWTITFNKILERDPLATDLLAFISCIEWRAIPYSILPAAHPEARLAGAIGTLCSYSFLEKRDNGTKLDMHRLVHLATRMWVNQNGREIETRTTAMKHLSQIFPSGDYTDREIWRDYFPHVAHIKKDEQCQDTEEKSELCLKVGRCLFTDGRMKEAVLWLRESCEWRDKNLAQDDSGRLASQHTLAVTYEANGQVKEAVELLEHVVAIEAEYTLAGAYQANGQVKEAVELLKHVIAIRAEVLAEDHPDRLASQHTLASVYQVNGQVKEAVELLKYIIAIQAEVLAEDYPDRLASQHTLASAYQANGQVKEVVELLKYIIAIQAEVLAEDHPDRLASQHTLASAYQANGQVKEAVELLKYIIAIQAEVLAEDHPDRLASQHTLASAYQANGQVEEAVKLLKYVIAIRAEVLAEDHPDRLASQYALASAYQANGQVKEAVELLKYVIAIEAEVLAEDHPDRLASQHTLATEVLAEDHPSRLASQHTLASTYQANGQVKEAVELLKYIIAIRAEVLAEDHPDRLASQHTLASAYQANGQVKEAVELLKYIVAIQAEVLAEDHPSRLASQHTLASTYQANGQVKEAVELLKYIIAIRAEVLAEDHPSRLASQHTLASVYQVNGQVKEAVELLKYIIAIRAEVLAEDHPDRLASQHTLASAYQANGQVKEAVELLKYIVAIQAEVLAEDHPSRLASQHTLARAYKANGQVKEAVELLEYVITIKAEVLAEDHPSRLASQHMLAIAYQANRQVEEAVELLEHVVAIRAEVLAEDHPNRLISEMVLADFYEDLLKRSETEQSSVSSIEELAAEDGDQYQLNRAPEVPQATLCNSSASDAIFDQAPVDQELESSSSSKRRHLVRRLKVILRKGK